MNKWREGSINRSFDQFIINQSVHQLNQTDRHTDRQTVSLPAGQPTNQQLINKSFSQPTYEFNQELERNEKQSI